MIDCFTVFHFCKSIHVSNMYIHSSIQKKSFAQNCFIYFCSLKNCYFHSSYLLVSLLHYHYHLCQRFPGLALVHAQLKIDENHSHQWDAQYKDCNDHKDHNYHNCHNDHKDNHMNNDVTHHEHHPKQQNYEGVRENIIFELQTVTFLFQMEKFQSSNAHIMFKQI